MLEEQQPVKINSETLGEIRIKGFCQRMSDVSNSLGICKSSKRRLVTSPFNIYSMLAHPLTEVKGQTYYALYGFVCLNLDCQSVGWWWHHVDLSKFKPCAHSLLCVWVQCWCNSKTKQCNVANKDSLLGRVLFPTLICCYVLFWRLLHPCIVCEKINSRLLSVGDWNLPITTVA